MPRQEDIIVGQRIRHRRLALSLSQTAVADTIGVKFQQLQKYETGMNRVSASRLVDLGRALGVPPAYFFEGIDGFEPTNEIKSADEATLLQKFRESRPDAQKALVRIAQATAQTCA